MWVKSTFVLKKNKRRKNINRGKGGMHAKECTGLVFEWKESCNTDMLAPWTNFIFLVG